MICENDSFIAASRFYEYTDEKITDSIKLLTSSSVSASGYSARR